MAVRRTSLLVLVGLVLVALNLRPAAVSIGPVLAEVRAGLGTSALATGLLTSLPVLAFAVFGALSPRLARLVGLHPLRSYQHGDLNAANVLIDLRGSLWLIDFASTGPDKNPFTDGAKLFSALLFEYFPIPLSLDEVRSASPQKLKDAFGLPSTQIAEELRERWEGCTKVGELVQVARELGLDEGVERQHNRDSDAMTSAMP